MKYALCFNGTPDGERSPSPVLVYDAIDTAAHKLPNRCWWEVEVLDFVRSTQMGDHYNVTCVRKVPDEVIKAIPVYTKRRTARSTSRSYSLPSTIVHLVATGRMNPAFEVQSILAQPDAKTLIADLVQRGMFRDEFKSVISVSLMDHTHAILSEIAAEFRMKLSPLLGAMLSLKAAQLIEAQNANAK